MYCHAKYLLYIVKWEEKPVIEQCAEYDLTFVDTQVYTHVIKGVLLADKRPGL